MLWRRKRVAIALSALLATAAQAQDVTAIAEALAAQDAIPGAAVGWVEAGALEFAVAGERQASGVAPVEPDDLWHIGSLTKSMTAVLAARLVARGDVTWDASVVEGGPSLTSLLTHRSGLTANPGLLARAMLNRDWDAAQSDARARLIEAALRRRRAAGGYLYSNLGYIAAGQMLADAAGTEWEALIRDELFAPLSLQSAGFGPPGRTGLPAPWGHNASGRAIDPAGAGADNRPAFGPAGTVHLNAEAMLRYLRAHLTRDPELLPPELWATLHTPPEGDYAMGWVRRDDGSLWHNGSNTMWYAEAVIDHASGRAAFVAVNSGDLAAVTGPVGTALAALMTR